MVKRKGKSISLFLTFMMIFSLMNFGDILNVNAEGTPKVEIYSYTDNLDMTVVFSNLPDNVKDFKYSLDGGLFYADDDSENHDYLIDLYDKATGKLKFVPSNKGSAGRVVSFRYTTSDNPQDTDWVDIGSITPVSMKIVSYENKLLTLNLRGLPQDIKDFKYNLDNGNYYADDDSDNHDYLIDLYDSTTGNLDFNPTNSGLEAGRVLGLKYTTAASPTDSDWNFIGYIVPVEDTAPPVSEEVKWQTALEEINKIGSVKDWNDTNEVQAKSDAVKTILDVLKPFNWNDLTGTSKRVDVPEGILSQRLDNGFKDIDSFKIAVKLSVMKGAVNDLNYDDKSINEYISLLDNLNYKNFADMPSNKKYVVASLIKYALGLDDGGYVNLYDKFNDFSVVLEQALSTMETAAVKTIALWGTGNAQSLSAGQKSNLTGFEPAGEGSEIIFSSSNIDVASIDLRTGEINPKSLGTVTLSYLLMDTETYALKSYGVLETNVTDEVKPTGTMAAPEEGKMNSILVSFSERMNPSTTSVTDVVDLVESLSIKRTNGDVKVNLISQEDSVTWINDRMVKINIPEVTVNTGDKFLVNFKDSVKDIAGNNSNPLQSSAAMKDIYKPVGKILMPDQGSTNEIKIMFNEEMSRESKKLTKTSDLIKEIILTNGKTSKKITAKAVSFTTINNHDALVININNTNVAKGEYFIVKYTDKLKDLAGNVINTNPTILPIGGALSANNDDIYEEIRKAAGGKTPVVAIVGSSRENLEAAEASYNDILSAQSGYAFLKHGFQPVFLPIAVDNYTSAAVDKNNVDILNSAFAVYFQGGDQAKHSRSFLNNDGTDTTLMTALRQLASSGGVITGASAGDHILSNPMLVGGESYESFKTNSIKVFTVDQYKDMTDGDTNIMPGFGFLSSYGLTDSHFDARGRLGRLLLAMKETKQHVGIGLDENTGLKINGDSGTVYGEKGVFIIDDTNAEYSKGKYYEATGIKINYLTAGDSYNFKTKLVTSSKLEINAVNAGTGTAYNSSDVFDDYETTKTLTSLVNSNIIKSVGYTKESDPKFALEFIKNENSKCYGDSNSEKYTLANIDFNVKQFVALQELKLNKKEAELKVNDTIELKVIITPENAIYEGLTWISSDSKVAKVDPYGKVTALKAGTAEITVKTADGTQIAKCKIIAKEAKKTLSEEKKVNKDKENKVELKENNTVKISVILPEGALKADGTIKISELLLENADVESKIAVMSNIYESTIDESDYQFDKPITISVAVDSIQGIDTSNLRLAYYDEENARWIVIGGSKYENGKVTGMVSHFSKFAVVDITKLPTGYLVQTGSPMDTAVLVILGMMLIGAGLFIKSKRVN